jgi:hypothetical protein
MKAETSAQYVKAALVDNAAQFWTESGQKKLDNFRRSMLGELHLDTVKMAIASAIGDIPPSGTIIDFGIGNAPFYPMIGSNEAKLIAIDPAKNEVNKAIYSGRIKKNTQIISKSKPPYDEIPMASADAIIGVSSFHILTNPEMQEIFKDLIKDRLKINGSIVHIQDIGPLANFLVNIDLPRFQKMEQYILNKYKIKSLKAGNLDDEGGWWGMVYRNVVKEMNDWGAYLFKDNGFIHTTMAGTGLSTFPNMDLNQELFDLISSQMKTSKKEIINYVNQDGGLGIVGIALANENLEKFIKDLPRDDRLDDLKASIHCAASEVNQDWLEAYLATTFNDLGLPVYVDRVTSVVKIPNSDSYVHTIDGLRRSGKVSEGDSGYSLSSVKRVHGVKI